MLETQQMKENRHFQDYICMSVALIRCLHNIKYLLLDFPTVAAVITHLFAVDRIIAQWTTFLKIITISSLFSNVKPTFALRLQCKQYSHGYLVHQLRWAKQRRRAHVVERRPLEYCGKTRPVFGGQLVATLGYLVTNRKGKGRHQKKNFRSRRNARRRPS